MAKKRLTIKQIAEACGVTIATVSRAINNQPGMREELRQHILQYIENIGWRSNSLQHQLPILPQQGKNVIFIAHRRNLTGCGFRPSLNIMGILIDHLSDEGVQTSVLYGNLQDSLDYCLALKPDAVILNCGSSWMQDSLDALTTAGVRVISAFGDNSLRCLSVLFDHHALGQMAMQRLLERDCQKIGFFAGLGIHPHPDKKQQSISFRYREILKGMQDANSDFDPSIDAVSDCFGDISEFMRIFAAGNYDGWFVVGREIFNIYQYAASQLGIDPIRELPTVVALAPTDNYDPVLNYDHAYESAERISATLLSWLQADVFPEPVTQLIPYVWKMRPVTSKVISRKKIIAAK